MTLQSLRARAKKIKKGFTLVELMIVVAIIAILAAAIVIGYAHARTSSQVATSAANLKEISTALELYYSDNQAYPASAASISSATFGDSGDASGQTYMPAAPKAPGAVAAYELTTTGNGYVIGDQNVYAAQDVKSVCPSATTASNYLVYSNTGGLGCNVTGASTQPAT